ncbi:MAG: DEAD/DEAH box helicase [Acidimicrobiaceae bacterium]|nr:DEAD/DEAH box helicase [Acidimicrobiaceae bacterium]MYF44549.1 DEAD/DEAH box helicase [Acidimicrobiaceae bacterium]MYJ35664.1 DEAD/DEAH box helicase [Acidimicrobiaceae bacterium]
MSPTFAQLGVPHSIDRALASRGITKPFEIQAAVLADALAGHDICGRAPTGSGKTLAFGIPLVANAGRAGPHKPKALVLAPTRELADQIMTEIRSFAGGVRIAVVYGGVGYDAQRRSLRKGVDILVACPGRLEDLIDQREVSLSAVDRVVIDEADRMADMGFIPAVRRLLDQTAPEPQTMLFSATLDGDVASLTRDYQHRPVRYEIGEETPDVVAADHLFWNVSSTERTEVAADAVTAAGSAIVFCRTRHGCDRLARRFDRIGVRAAAIHGGRSQNQRTRALQAFAAGRVEALIATDVAARGIHVEGVSAVIHYDPPGDHKTYLHRSGRTARAGRGGVVVSLVQPGQVKELRHMQRELDLQQPLTDVDLSAVRSLDGGASRPMEPAAITNPTRQPAVDSQPRRADGKPRHQDAKQRSRKPEGGRAKNRSRRRRSNNRRPRPTTAKRPMAKSGA